MEVSALPEDISAPSSYDSLGCDRQLEVLVPRNLAKSELLHAEKRVLGLLMELEADITLLLHELWSMLPDSVEHTLCVRSAGGSWHMPKL